VIVAVLCALAVGATPQDTGMLDVPVYRNEAYQVSLPRPFDDWVFSAGRAPRTTTVLFHPRRAPLRDQLWGALVLMSFDAPVPLEAVADQRLQETWQSELGRSFRLLTRDSLSLGGLPAVHLVMAGAVNRLAVDVEEYVVAHGRDLVILQFRYPRGLPRDSIAAGYERSFAGLRIGEAAVAATAAPQPVVSEGDDEVNRALAGSPWRLRAVEARVRVDPGGATFAVRMEVANDDVRPHDTLVVAVRTPWVIDSVRGPTGRAFAGARGTRVGVRLPQPVEALAATAITVHIRLPDASLGPGADRAPTEVIAWPADWLPVVQPWLDSLGDPLPPSVARRTTRFELPEGLAAVTAGRLAANLVVGGRRQMAWVADEEPFTTPGFVIGPLRRVLLRPGPLATVRVWASSSGEATPSGRVAEIADAVVGAWVFFTRSFGRLTFEDVEIVLTDISPPRVSGATLFISPLASLDSIRAAVARVWWGQTVRFTGPGAGWLARALPGWSAAAIRAASDGDSVLQRVVREGEAAGEPFAGLEAARRVGGDARFRTALRALFLEHRRRSASLADLRLLLGPEAGEALPALPRAR